MPDHRVRLTPEGNQQALEAGRKLRALLRPDDTLHFFTSPYRRTRETTEGILSALTSDDPAPSPFPRHTIKVYEEPRLREQDFGNFQPCTAEMERMWQERADYGHFFYRIPNGESAADAYDRISGFNDSLWRRFEENDFASVCILVTHGLMTRVFLMKWYHFSVEYFEDLRNVNHCEFVVMKKDLDNGKFILQNQLRTWSELKRERAARGSATQSNLNPVAPGIGDSPIPQRRRWGGCPDGCDHSQHNHVSRNPQPQRQNTADLFKDDNDPLWSLPMESLRLPSRHSSLKLKKIRSSPNVQPSRERHGPQSGDENCNGASDDDLSLPENEDTILDQDPDKIPPTNSSATQSLPQAASRPLIYRSRTAQPVSTPFNEPLVEEELSPSPHEDNVHTPKPRSSGRISDTNNSHPSPGNELSTKNLNRKLRSPRETALICMTGRDGGGSHSGGASSGSDMNETEEEEEEDEDEDEDEEKQQKKRKQKKKEEQSMQREPADNVAKRVEDDNDNNSDDEEAFPQPRPQPHLPHSTLSILSTNTKSSKPPSPPSPAPSKEPSTSPTSPSSHLPPPTVSHLPTIPIPSPTTPPQTIPHHHPHRPRHPHQQCNQIVTAPWPTL